MKGSLQSAETWHDISFLAAYKLRNKNRFVRTFHKASRGEPDLHDPLPIFSTNNFCQQRRIASKP